MFKRVFNKSNLCSVGNFRRSLLHSKAYNFTHENIDHRWLYAMCSVAAVVSGGIVNSQCDPQPSESHFQHLKDTLHRIESKLNHQHSRHFVHNGRVDVVVGAQWGDEGKGKLVDIISKDYDICARVAGGSNAGHTIVVEGKKHKFHLIPSAILHPQVHCVIGNGVVVNIKGLLTELDSLDAAGVAWQNRILISDRAHIVFDLHQQLDKAQESSLGEAKKIGTTLKGIGPAYGSKVMRNGLRMGDLQDMNYFEARFRALATQVEHNYPNVKIDVDAELAYYRSVRPKLLPMIVDSVAYAHNALRQGRKILVEGANALMLDLDFGTYPYVTSSNPSIGSACTGLGVPPHYISRVTAIVKAYCTRVGEGPFPSELHGQLETDLREKGGEYGTTTGRPRRVGWIDIPQLKYSMRVNGSREINLTKVDVLTGLKEIKVGVRYRLTKEKAAKHAASLNKSLTHVDGDYVVLDYMPASLSVYNDIEMEYITLPGWTEDISKCRRFQELPKNCQRYILTIEALLNSECEQDVIPGFAVGFGGHSFHKQALLHHCPDSVSIRYIGVGPDRVDMIDRQQTDVWDVLKYISQ